MTKNVRRLGVGLLLLIALVFACRHAGAVVLVEEGGAGMARPIDLSGSVDILLDPTNRLGIDDVLSPAFEPRFTRWGAQRRRPIDTNNAVWIRFTLAREAGGASDWVVQLHPSWIDDIDVYQVQGREARLGAVLGDWHPFSQRAVKTTALAFPVSVGTQPQTYYLRIKTHGPMPLVLNAWREAGLVQREANREALNLPLAGGVIVLVLMLVMFWVRIRERIFLIFALLIATGTVLVFTIQGYGNSLLFPDNALWADRFVDVMNCAFAVIAEVFFCRIFDFRSYSIAVARVLDGIAIFFALLIPVAVFGLMDWLWWWVITLIGVLAAVNEVLLIWLITRQKRREDLIVTAMFLLVTTVWIFRLGIQQGLLPIDNSFLERPVMQILQAGNLLLLSVAVGNRLFNIEQQRRAESKRAFESMQLAARALEERARQREFVAVVSQEFRAPLATVAAVSDALEALPPGTDDRVKRSVQKIRQATARLNGLIGNLLVDEALESATGQTENECFDLREVVASVENNCLPGDRERLVHAMPDTALPLRGSRARIEMLLSNVVQNALKYSSSEVRLGARIEGALLILEVLNFGDPIPPSEQDQLFERYFRGTRPSPVPGSGLGLHISRSIARQHGGELELVTSDAQGTVFRITLALDIRTGAPS